MRILVVSNLYPPNVVGGYERLCFEVTQGLAALGNELVVLTSDYGGEVADYPGQRVLRNLRLLTGPDIYTPFAGDRDTANAANLATLRRTLDDAQPDVVFAWNLFFLHGGLLQALEASRVRTVVMLTDNWLLVMRNAPFWQRFWDDSVLGETPFRPSAPKLWARLRSRLGQRSGLEAVFGSTFVRDLYEAGGVAFGRQRVIHNGVKQAYAAGPHVDRSRLVEPGTLRLLFAGRLVDLKGAHTAVAAYARLTPIMLGVDRVKLTLLGDVQDVGYVTRLQQEIVESGRAGDIEFAMPVLESELPVLFNAHDIYLFPSLYEPFSLTLIHALALGIPTIASDAGGNVEIVKDGTNGLLFRKGDSGGLAERIHELAADGTLRAKLAAGGRQAAAQFTFERMIGGMADFLQGR